MSYLRGLQLLALNFFSLYCSAQIPFYYKHVKSVDDSLKTIIQATGLDSSWPVGEDGIKQISFAVIDVTGKKPVLGGVNFKN